MCSVDFGGVCSVGAERESAISCSCRRGESTTVFSKFYFESIFEVNSKSNVFRIEKQYICSLRQICFAIWTNIFVHLDKYIFNLDKYILQFNKCLEKNFAI